MSRVPIHITSNGNEVCLQVTPEMEPQFVSSVRKKYEKADRDFMRCVDKIGRPGFLTNAPADVQEDVIQRCNEACALTDRYAAILTLFGIEV